MFDLRPSRMKLRREFKEYKWKPGNAFSDYYHYKLILANNVPVEEIKVIDYLIDGIPDEQLQNQARLQRFKNKADLLSAFEMITISDPRSHNSMITTNKAEHKTGRSTLGDKEDKAKGKEDKNKDKVTKKQIRCFNCGKNGHWAKECQQEPREKGACFKCGEMGHTIKDCPKNSKNQINYVYDVSSTGDFKKVVTLKGADPKVDFSIKLEALINTGSPISFIKAKYIPSNCIQEMGKSSMKFCGINDSQLRILGNIKVQVELDSVKKDDLIVYIVSDNTITVPAVIDRYFEGI